MLNHIFQKKCLLCYCISNVSVFPDNFPQLTCMYNLVNGTISQNFTDYPSDMLLFFKWVCLCAFIGATILKKYKLTYRFCNFMSILSQHQRCQDSQLQVILFSAWCCRLLCGLQHFEQGLTAAQWSQDMLGEYFYNYDSLQKQAVGTVRGPPNWYFEYRRCSTEYTASMRYVFTVVWDQWTIAYRYEICTVQNS